MGMKKPSLDGQKLKVGIAREERGSQMNYEYYGEVSRWDCKNHLIFSFVVGSIESRMTLKAFALDCSHVHYLYA